MRSTTDCIVLTGKDLKNILGTLCPDETDEQLNSEICITRVVSVQPEHGDRDVEIFAEDPGEPESRFLVAS